MNRCQQTNLLFFFFFSLVLGRANEKTKGLHTAQYPFPIWMGVNMSEFNPIQYIERREKPGAHPIGSWPSKSRSHPVFFFFSFFLSISLSLSLSLHASKERIQYTFIRIWFDNLSSSSCYYILRLSLLLSAAYKTVFRYWTCHLLPAIFSLECDSWLLVIAVAVAASVFYIVFVLVVAERLFHYFRETTSRPSCCCCCCCCCCV